ncbi:MAG: futalosine hydrolase [Saprospiraceae bacterium]|nr:futalosine hydrolase [Saprospiraceae bacterium]MBK8484513.1 futalosine hydrolase [Saprospiraceae bacterium]MBK9221889.1 futalosine hydrolase [Saprospiraceae bacterium]MBK9728170.1 futalosine hydrolase [Saprospiraceae bacterium]
MRVLLVSATENEIKPCLNHFEDTWKKNSFLEYEKDGLQISPLVTGISSMMMAFALARYQQIPKLSFIIHAGVSGSYHATLPPGSLVEVISEEWADLGAENQQGELIDAFTLGLLDKNRFPYQNGKILKTHKTIQTNLKQVHGLSVNKTSGNQFTIDQIINKFNGDVESMEGIGLFYACRTLDVPFLSIRSISNYVEPRNKENWQLQKAIEQLNIELINILNKLQ